MRQIESTVEPGKERCPVRTRSQGAAVRKSVGGVARSFFRDYGRRERAPLRSAGRGRGQSSTEAAFNAGAQDSPDAAAVRLSPSPIPGQSFNVEAQVFNQSPEKLAVESVTVAASDGKNWNVRADKIRRQRGRRAARNRNGALP